MKTGIGGAVLALTFALTLGVAVPGWAQEKVGVVTTAIGPVTVARASLPPEPLKFRDDVFLRDRVATGEDAITRILLGGKVIITAREHSTLTITETPGLSTIHLTSGRIAVAVEKSRMKPGERVDIRTPNAVAGVRGTVLIVEADANTSTVTVLRGLVHVTRLHLVTGAPIGKFTAVGARQTVTVRESVLPARSKAITQHRAQELSQEFTPPLKAVTAATITHDSDEVKRALAKSDVSVPGSPAERSGVTAAAPGSAPGASGAPAAAAVSTSTPVAASAPGLATATTATPAPLAASAPPVSTPPVVSAPPVVPASPVAVVTLPTPAAVPAVAKSGSSFKVKLDKLEKFDRDDRSGSNSGKR